MTPKLDRNLDPTHAYAIGQMLNAYTEWLNTWWTFNNGPDHRTPEPEPYTPTHFLDWKPDNPQPLYGDAHIDAIYAQHHIVYALTISDGDDGGDTHLTGYFDDWPVTQGGLTLDHMTQEFDTGLTIAMHDGKLTYHGKETPCT